MASETLTTLDWRAIYTQCDFKSFVEMCIFFLRRASSAGGRGALSRDSNDLSHPFHLTHRVFRSFRDDEGNRDGQVGSCLDTCMDTCSSPLAASFLSIGTSSLTASQTPIETVPVLRSKNIRRMYNVPVPSQQPISRSISARTCPLASFTASLRPAQALQKASP